MAQQARGTRCKPLAPASRRWGPAFRWFWLRVFGCVLNEAAFDQPHPELLMIVSKRKQHQILRLDHAFLDEELEIDQLRPIGAVEQNDGHRGYFSGLVQRE